MKNDPIKEALKRVMAEEDRLTAKLSKVRAVRQALQRAAGTSVAPAGTLDETIVEQLRASRKSMSNGELRRAIKRSGYLYSLSLRHVSKTLTRLLAEQRVKRIGAGTASRYMAAAQKV